MIQALATAVVILGNRQILNADAVSDLQIAGHDCTGSIGLAVNGSWSPMLCWLIAPYLGRFDEPSWAGWLVTGLSGLGFTLGSWAVCRVLELNRTECGFAVTIVALTTATSMRSIVPDWLMSGLLLLGFALLLGRDWAERPRIALASGLIALPWIAVPSVRYGHLTFSTAAEAIHALVGPRPLIERTHLWFRALIPPAAGQLTAWEDPSRQAHRSWSPLRDPEALAYQWMVVQRNLQKTWMSLRSFDRLRLGFLAMVAGLLWHRPWWSTLASGRWR